MVLVNVGVVMKYSSAPLLLIRHYRGHLVVHVIVPSPDEPSPWAQSSRHVVHSQPFPATFTALRRLDIIHRIDNRL